MVKNLSPYRWSGPFETEWPAGVKENFAGAVGGTGPVLVERITPKKIYAPPLTKYEYSNIVIFK
jgi:hypothetical protein